MIIGGDNGGGSAGDELMCEAACAYFRSVSSDLIIVTDAQRSDWVSPVVNIKIIQQVRKDWVSGKVLKYFMLIKKIIRLLVMPYVINRNGFDWLIGHGKYFKEHLISSDALFFAGCGGLNDKYPINVLAWWSMISSAKKIGVKVYISGVGIGPIKNRLVRDLVIRVIRLAEFTSVRDTGYSYEFMEKFFQREKYDWVPDDAFFYKSSGTKNKIGKSLKIGLNLMPSLFKDNGKIETVAYLIKKNLRVGDKLYLLPVTHEDHYILSIVKNIIPSSILIDCCSPSMMKEVVSSMSIMIASRYHGCVFGVSQKVPTYGIFGEIYWKQKIEGLFSMSGINNSVFSLSEFIGDLKEERLYDRIQEIKNNVISEKVLNKLHSKQFLAHKIASNSL